MSKTFLKSEEEFRHLLLEGLLKSGIKAWNCTFENCPEPIIVNGIPMKVKGVDIVYKGVNRRRGIELKLFRLKCIYASDRGSWKLRRISNNLTQLEYEVIKRGSGILVAVAEPPRSSKEQKELGRKMVTEENCQYQRRVLLERLGRNERKYLCAIIGKDEIENVRGNKTFYIHKTNWGAVNYLSLSFGQIWDNAEIRFSSELRNLLVDIISFIPR